MRPRLRLPDVGDDLASLARVVKNYIIGAYSPLDVQRPPAGR
ncbi:MAG TPA: hypothetical protein PK586_05330 [Casimicrobium sp.]|nr:hypothetical protein [Casimicrobium sp.]